LEAVVLRRRHWVADDRGPSGPHGNIEGMRETYLDDLKIPRPLRERA
jgi:hypothetical protein